MFIFSCCCQCCILCNAQARGRGGTLRPGAWGLRLGTKRAEGEESDEARSESEKTRMWV